MGYVLWTGWCCCVASITMYILTQGEVEMDNIDIIHRFVDGDCYVCTNMASTQAFCI